MSKCDIKKNFKIGVDKLKSVMLYLVQIKMKEGFRDEIISQEGLLG